MKKLLLSGLFTITFISSIRSQSHVLSATQYNIHHRGAVVASGDEIDASKLKKRKIRWVALSRDMFKHYPMNSKIMVYSKDHPELNGVWVVKDKMAIRHRACIDFLIYKGQSSLDRVDVKIQKI